MRQTSQTAKASTSEVVIRVTGTSPLSFDLEVGTILEVRESDPSPHSRPSIGGGFKSKGFLLFRDRTKVGHLSIPALTRIGIPVPPIYEVYAVGRVNKVLLVELGKTRRKEGRSYDCSSGYYFDSAKVGV